MMYFKQLVKFTLETSSIITYIFHACNGERSYIGDAENEFPSGVQGVFFLPTLNAKDVHLAKMAACGYVFGVGGERYSPGID